MDKYHSASLVEFIYSLAVSCGGYVVCGGVTHSERQSKRWREHEIEKGVSSHRSEPLGTGIVIETLIAAL